MNTDDPTPCPPASSFILPPSSFPPPLPRRRELTPDEFFAGVRAGDVAVLARALTLVESSNPRHQRLAEELLTRLLPHTGGAVRVGITGVPGVGKSTFIEALGLDLVGRGLRVAVLAVDPSSGVSGGSILGHLDRCRKRKCSSTQHERITAATAACLPPAGSALLGGDLGCARSVAGPTCGVGNLHAALAQRRRSL